MKSPLQKNILTLYRNFLKFTSSNFDRDKQVLIRNKIRNEFEINRGISRLKVNYIEFKLREGKNLLKSLESGNITNIDCLMEIKYIHKVVVHDSFD